MTATRPVTTRRRVEAQWLRWQARAEGPAADRMLPWLIAALLFVLWFGLAYARARSLDGGADLASGLQARWLIAHGQAADLTVTGNHLLAQHFPLGFYGMVWVTQLLPPTSTLLGIQSLSLALGVVPLWWIARRLAALRVGAALAIVVAYALSPTLNNLNLADFHPAVVAVGPLLAATYAALRERWVAFALFSAFAVLWSAELGLVIAGLGVLLIIRDERKAGVWAVVFGFGWTLLAVVLFEPRYGSTGFIAPGAFAEYGSNAFSVGFGMLVHPFRALGDLFAEGNVRLLVVLLAPLLFLPVLSPRALLPAIPLQALYLIANEPDRSVEVGLPLTIFAFVAATFALNRMGRKGVERVLVDRRVLIALVVAALGFFATEASDSPYRHPWQWGRQDAVDMARRQAAHAVGKGVSVRAPEVVLPLVADRKKVYLFDAKDDAAAAVDGVDRVVVDDVYFQWTTTQDTVFATAITALEFQLIYRSQGVAVYARVGT